MTGRAGRTRRPAAALPILAIGAAAGLACMSCARRPAQAHAVAIRNFLYEPATVTVAPGDTVVFTNADFVPHTATARDTSWDSKSIAGNGTWRMVASRPGRQEYYCVFHPNMRGTIEVR